MTDPYLHRRFPELAAHLPYLSLGEGPTPVRELALDAGLPVWCKDESGYGAGGWGGNKIRKLEWLLPEALRRGAHTILTVGGTGTNWGLAVARYGREYGIDTVLALVDQPTDDHVRAQLARLENSGAVLRFTRTKARTMVAAPWLMLRHARGAKLPYYLPVGGSSPIGALGYVEAAFELADQVAAGELPEPAHLVVPVGSGGTAAGLALRLKWAGLRTRVLGVVVNDSLPLDARRIVGLAERAGAVLVSRGLRVEPPVVRADEVTILRDWLGPGYGHPTPRAVRAAERAASVGLRLETVYTAKAFAAVPELIARGALGDGPVLFLNTYGPRADPPGTDPFATQR
ncbi:pyridoxal-phosphate dependent enzyme [Nocardia sp. NBC_01377]